MTYGRAVINDATRLVAVWFFLAGAVAVGLVVLILLVMWMGRNDDDA